MLATSAVLLEPCAQNLGRVVGNPLVTFLTTCQTVLGLGLFVLLRTTSFQPTHTEDCQPISDADITPLVLGVSQSVFYFLLSSSDPSAPRTLISRCLQTLAAMLGVWGCLMLLSTFSMCFGAIEAAPKLFAIVLLFLFSSLLLTILHLWSSCDFCLAPFRSSSNV